MLNSTVLVKMNLDDFAEAILKEITDAGFNAAIGSVWKQNRNTKTVMIHIPGSKTVVCLRVEDIYEDYKNGVPFNDIARACVGFAGKAVRTTDDSASDVMRVVENRVTAWSFLTLGVCDPSWNEEYLKDTPCRKEAGMALFCRVAVPMNGGDVGFVKVNNGLLGRWGVSEDEVFEAARKNDEANGAVLMCMNDMMNTVCGFDIDDAVNLLDTPDADVNPGIPMYVLTNRKREYGAPLIMNRNIRRKIAEVMKSDFYVLPSSVHEVMIVPCGVHNPEALLSMVKEINHAEVKPDDRLSDSIFICSAETAEMKMMR